MQEEIYARYEQLQQIVMDHFEAALAYTAGPALLDIVRRLGFAGERLLPEASGESVLLVDLAIYTAKEGRSRALDRYAREAGLRAGSDQARVLETMRGARFSIWRVERAHERAGVVVSDLLRGSGEEFWLPDPDLADEPGGVTFAARLGDIDGFALACNMIVPVDRDMFEEVAADPLAFRHADPARIASDPRFATAVYRAAIELGAMEFLAATGAARTARAEALPAEA
jgi:hypothetical protein